MIIKYSIVTTDGSGYIKSGEVDNFEDLFSIMCNIYQELHELGNEGDKVNG